MSCQKPKSDDGGGGVGPTPTPSQGQFTTDCGTVVDGIARNPVNASSGERVTVTSVIAHNAVAVNRNGGQQIIKFRALSDSVSSSVDSSARSTLNNLLGEATLFTDDCGATVIGGGSGVVGDLIRDNGVSLTERLLSRGAAAIQSSGPCSEGQVASCYDALLDQNQQTGSTVSNFLWQPETPGDGWLAVLLDPANATIFVNGDRLVDTGPSSGRGTTGRTNKPGCAFGNNIKVEVFNSNGNIIPFPDGKSSYTIPNGCDTVEF